MSESPLVYPSSTSWILGRRLLDPDGSTPTSGSVCSRSFASKNLRGFSWKRDWHVLHSHVWLLYLCTRRRTFTIGWRITVQLVSSLTRLDLTKKENMLGFVCSETAEVKLVKLETSRPPMVSVRCTRYSTYINILEETRYKRAITI